MGGVRGPGLPVGEAELRRRRLQFAGGSLASGIILGVSRLVGGPSRAAGDGLFVLVLLAGLTAFATLALFKAWPRVLYLVTILNMASIVGTATLAALAMIGSGEADVGVPLAALTLAGVSVLVLADVRAPFSSWVRGDFA